VAIQNIRCHQVVSIGEDISLHRHGIACHPFNREGPTIHLWMNAFHHHSSSPFRWDHAGFKLSNWKTNWRQDFLTFAKSRYGNPPKDRINRKNGTPGVPVGHPITFHIGSLRLKLKFVTLSITDQQDDLRGMPMRVLVAEDNLVFQWGLRAMLTQWGYDVVVVSDGIEAWGQLQNEEGPHLAILDWLMPGLDGVDVCRRVRASNQSNYTYILILTGKTDSEDLVTAMEAGADDYVTKPFKSAELRARLRAGCRILELQERLRLFRPSLVVPAPVETAELYSTE
jgi:CheY-like chemotaxis protein